MRAILFALVVFFGTAGGLEAQVFENGGTPGSQTVLGWNYGHFSNCYAVVNQGQTWFWAFFQEPGSGFGYTNNPGFATLVASACQTGNVVGIFVTSLNPFRWTQVVTFTFK